MDELEPFREEAIRALSTALATDRITFEQFESRLGHVRQAPNRATLDAILADLVPSGGFVVPAGLVAVADRTAVAPYTLNSPVEPAEVLRIKSVMGSTTRAGSWTVPLRLELKVVMGEAVIDLRDAVFCSDVLDIDLHAVLSNVKLIVPAGTQVENECEERFSNTTHSVRSGKGSSPIGLLIRINGQVRLSNLEIKEKPPTSEEPEKPRWMKLLGAGD